MKNWEIISRNFVNKNKLKNLILKQGKNGGLKMDIKLVDRGTDGELIMSGDLDTKTSRDADQLFEQMADRFTNITLNMKNLDYVSSAGLRAIRNLYIKLSQKQGKLTITNVNENVMEVFEMTGLAGLLNIR